jgi:hypothetical protein
LIYGYIGIIVRQNNHIVADKVLAVEAISAILTMPITCLLSITFHRFPHEKDVAVAERASHDRCNKARLFSENSISIVR